MGKGRVLYIDIGECSECLGCCEIAPDLFRYNTQTGCMEVADIDTYDSALIDEAMKNCPKDCIKWEEDDS